jgi:hypothetical protein
MDRFREFRLPGVVVVCAAMGACAAVNAQCELGWVNDFGGAETLEGEPPSVPALDWNTIIDTMVSYDPDGDGPLAPRLIVGGQFTHIGGVEVSAIAQWDGLSWSALGPGLVASVSPTPRVVDLLVHDDDGTGPLPPAMYAATYGVSLRSDPANVGYVLRWNGTDWTILGGDLEPFRPASLAFFDDGHGELLYATGVGHMLSRLEPGGWRAIWPNETEFILGNKLIPTRIGETPVLAVLGAYRLFHAEGIILQSAMAWNAEIADVPTLTGYRRMGSGLNGRVQDAMNIDEDGDGPLPESLFVVGSFTHASNDPTGIPPIPARHIARWDGERWHGVGPEPDRQWFYRGITSITVFDDGSGPALYAGGYIWYSHDAPRLILGVAKWTGSEWVRVGVTFGDDDDYHSPPNSYGIIAPGSQIRQIVAHPDAYGHSTLFASGCYEFADGQPAAYIARLSRRFARGDADADGRVDFGDVVAALENWEAHYSFENTGPGDADGDGDVDFADITIVLTHFGAACP